MQAAPWRRDLGWVLAGLWYGEFAPYSRDYLLLGPPTNCKAALFRVVSRLCCVCVTSRVFSLPVTFFWTLRINRAFLPSCLGFPKQERDFSSGWSAQGSDRYSRIKRLRVLNMQKAFVKVIHDRRLSDLLGKSEIAPHDRNMSQSSVLRCRCPSIRMSAGIGSEVASLRVKPKQDKRRNPERAWTEVLGDNPSE